jgi:hypothetical protein
LDEAACTAAWRPCAYAIIVRPLRLGAASRSGSNNAPFSAGSPLTASVGCGPAPLSIPLDLAREDQAYGGVRVEVVARVTNARVRLQVDVGFGDAAIPEAMVVELPPLLDFPAPRLRTYPRETVVAGEIPGVGTVLPASGRLILQYSV